MTKMMCNFSKYIKYLICLDISGINPSLKSQDHLDFRVIHLKKHSGISSISQPAI